jgi:DNA-binding NarL/FixJ family response regulator
MLNLAAQVTRLKSRILLVDDHELVRAGIACLLENEPELEICGQAANGREAIEKVSELKPDLVLLDLGMPIMGGTQAARQIRKVAPEIKIVLLSMHDSDTIEQLSKLIEVDAYLTKGCSRDKLKTTIAHVLSTRH